MNAGGSLGGCRLVVTRPEEQAEELAQPLRARGADVRIRPLVRVEWSDNEARLRDALAALDRFDLVVFTSANAVRICVELQPAPGWPPVACVGSATARAAAAAGMAVALVPGTFTAEGLAAELCARGGLAGKRVLWPRAEGARPVLRELLVAAGALVTDVVAYRTVGDGDAVLALARELEEAPADVLVMTSPSAVYAYDDAAGRPPCPLAVIGTVTQAAAVARGMDVAVTPERHDGAGLVAALETWYSEVRSRP